LIRDSSGRGGSDARRTRRELIARRDLSATAKRVLGRLFGKMELRFTRNRCYSSLNGQTDSAAYAVVAKDASSVAIVSPDLATGKDSVRHIHFVGDSHFWINVGTGVFREFFQRVQPDRRSQPTLRANVKRHG